MASPTLDAFLNSYCAAQPTVVTRAAVAATVRELAAAAARLRVVITQGALGHHFAVARGANAGGDVQKELDIHADSAFLEAARHAPVAIYGSEELESPVVLDPGAPLALAIDPLDGSSNIDTNVSIGTIFAILPALGDMVTEPASSFLQPGRSQLAAGFFIYGPQLALTLTLGSGTHIFVFSNRVGDFVEAYESRQIPARATNSRSTPRTTGTGTRRSASISTTA